MIFWKSWRKKFLVVFASRIWNEDETRSSKDALALETKAFRRWSHIDIVHFLPRSLCGVEYLCPGIPALCCAGGLEKLTRRWCESAINFMRFRHLKKFNPTREQARTTLFPAVFGLFFAAREYCLKLYKTSWSVAEQSCQLAPARARVSSEFREISPARS